ncbi:MAG: hypothetical protein QM655_07420 [Nocardioidaceae bacterium]
MSSVTRPKGPLPARVYWFRRGLVLVTALALVYAIAHYVGGSGDGRDPKAQTMAGDSTPSLTPSPTITTPLPTTPADSKTAQAGKDAKDKQAKKQKATKTPTASPLAQPSGPCDVDDVVVTASTDDARAGGVVPITLNVTSKESAACTFEVSSSSVVLRITSGSDKIWSSQQCPGAIPTVTVVARPEKAGTAVVNWKGRRSDETCSRQAGWAMPGYYHVQAAPLGGDPTDVQFKLGAAVAKTITPKPKHDKDKKKT